MSECQCGCGLALGKDPRAKYATGACRVRAHRQRSVTSVTSHVRQGFTQGGAQGVGKVIASLKREVRTLQDQAVKDRKRHQAECQALRGECRALCEEIARLRFATGLARGTSKLDAFLGERSKAFTDVKRALWKRYHPDTNPNANPRDIQDLNAALDAIKRTVQ